MVFKNRAEPFPKGLVLLMAAACGFTVANVYLNQTLLVSMANTFHVSENYIGIVATLTQVGYALGNLLLVPLGDIFERRKLILSLLSIVCIILAATALSMNVTWLIAANLILGFVTIVPQIIVPLAANLASEENRGKVLGNVAIGLVCGILGARFISGFADSHFGWRSMYWASFAGTMIMIILMAMYLPKSKGNHAMQYKTLLASLGPLFKKEKVLQKACLSQGMMFGSFSAFWTTLIFLLNTSPYSYGSTAAGLIGLVGIAGAFATPMIGRVIDKKGSKFANTLCMFISLIAFLTLIFLGYWLPGLLLGALLVTVGTQANQVACQAAIFQLSSEKRSRLNGLYMVSTFLGGSLGSYLGVLAWSKWHWYGVCTVGILMIGIAFSSLFSLPKKRTVKNREFEKGSHI
ncbi:MULTISPECIES: MFS transporter [Bacillus]|uniref:MFS transporter n=1 Tax=Bacillus TaxID=1386 RepID=UPI00177D300C|nr:MULTISPECIES: MFS transporter [Bacillus]MCP1532236.1 putative MFS family arabinose efflux permease [Bacillus velezensis]MEC1382955.1 MFS transporter [Bacillus velezensis]QOH67644.1 MFS transporter [Bacillus amyloliquefaciens]QWQ27734.1 MFS transporter [Bacillus sp. JNUCC-22]WHY37973.1 MFS transporter [Bacillus velezensis]